MKSRIIIYQKPTCTTCRQVYAALKESGVDFDAVDYYLEPIPRSKLVELLRKLGMKPRDLLRTKEPIYRELRLGERGLSDEALVDLMVKHPDLIQRPIVEKGARAILARPPDREKRSCSPPLTASAVRAGSSTTFRTGPEASQTGTQRTFLPSA